MPGEWKIFGTDKKMPAVETVYLLYWYNVGAMNSAK
jgi:hypothetical protein